MATQPPSMPELKSTFHTCLPVIGDYMIYYLTVYDYIRYDRLIMHFNDLVFRQ